MNDSKWMITWLVIQKLKKQHSYRYVFSNWKNIYFYFSGFLAIIRSYLWYHNISCGMQYYFALNDINIQRLNFTFFKNIFLVCFIHWSFMLENFNYFGSAARKTSLTPKHIIPQAQMIIAQSPLANTSCNPRAHSIPAMKQNITPQNMCHNWLNLSPNDVPISWKVK